jgi:site-specific DNA recombinase
MTEAELIQTVYRWIGDERCSTYTVAERLNARRIPIAHIKHGHKWRGSSTWLPRTIAAIVHNPVYRGEHVFRRLSKKGGPQEYQYAVPALVPAALWQRAQQVIAANWHHKRTTSHREYLLRGLARCGRCGFGMSGQSVRKVSKGKDSWYFLYRCHGKHTAMIWLHGRCPSRFVPALKLEQIVWDELTRWIVDGTSLDTALTQALKGARGERDQMQHRVAKMRARLERLETERQRVIAWCRQGVIDERDLERQLTDVTHERQTLQQTVAALEQHLSRDADPHAALAHLHAHLARFQRAVRTGTLSPTDKRKIIESLVTEVRVFGTARTRNTAAPVIQQTIPLRASLPAALQEGRKEIVWQRTGATPEPQDDREKVQILYAFPFAPGEQAFSVLRGNMAESDVR